MNNHNNAPYLSLNSYHKDNNINQLQRVYSTLFARPMTMYEVALITGIERANVCRYVAELRKSNSIAVVRLGICPITRHDRVQFLTTNPALFPQETQLGLSFDNVPTCTTSNKKGVSKWVQKLTFLTSKHR